MSAPVGWFKALFAPPKSSSTPPSERELLFSGYLACFSTSVDPAIRVLWVKNGGTLTHTPEDFKKAQFFFCTGMDDSWLKELLARSLIVRHAAWVTLCVSEKFRMPIAKYTLDDGFDATKIRILDPSPLAFGDRRVMKKVKDLRGPAPPSATVEGSRKRRISDESEPYRPKKRARIDEQPTAEIYQTREVTATRSQPAGYSTPNAKDVDVSSRRISFSGRRAIPRGKVSKTAKIFESRIRLSNKTTRPAQKEPTETPVSPLNRHTLFWNDLLTKSYAKEVKTLTFSVKDLLLAPETKAVIFDVNNTYLGRPFINMAYA